MPLNWFKPTTWNYQGVSTYSDVIAVTSLSLQFKDYLKILLIK